MNCNSLLEIKVFILSSDQDDMAAPKSGRNRHKFNFPLELSHLALILIYCLAFAVSFKGNASIQFALLLWFKSQS